VNAIAHGLSFLVFQVISLFHFEHHHMVYGTWLHGLIILQSFLSYGDDLNGLTTLSSLCYFISYGCWYSVVISFVNFCYDNDDLITFCKHIHFSFWFSLSCGMILCWWCNLLFTFCYINGHLITLLQAAISYTHTFTTCAKQDKIWTFKIYPKRTQHT
jgi:hypothetical protein